MRVLSSYDLLSIRERAQWAVMLELRLVSGRSAFNKFRVGKSNFVCMNVKAFLLSAVKSPKSCSDNSVAWLSSALLSQSRSHVMNDELIRRLPVWVQVLFGLGEECSEAVSID